MSKGIALKFREKFGLVEILRSQSPKVGGVVWIRSGSRHIISLVTKRYIGKLILKLLSKK